MKYLRHLILFFCLSSPPCVAAVVSKVVYQQLKQVDRLIAQQSYLQAEKTLQQRLKKNNSRYEKAVLLRSLSSTYAAQKKYTEAIKHLKKVIAIKSLPYHATQKVQFMLGELYLINQQQPEAWALLEPWSQRNPHPTPKAAVLLANLFSQHQQYDKAILLVKKATQETVNPPKAWTDLQLALGYKTQDYQATILVLEKILKKDPENKQRWIQISHAHYNAENYNQAASFKHLAYQRGFLVTEAELIDLAQLFLQAHTPYKAAQFLQQQLDKNTLANNAKNLELLGTAWFNAKESVMAQKILEEAIALTPNASLYEKLAQIYTHQKQWQSALEAFTNALKLGKFEQPGTSQLLLGMTHYHLNNKIAAESAFEGAILHKEQALEAQKWLTYLQSSQF